MAPSPTGLVVGTALLLVVVVAAFALVGRRSPSPRDAAVGQPEVTGPLAGELGEAQLREHVERAWAEVSSIVDRIIGSGRMLDREVLLDLARFLESAMPAVAAYERLVARAYEEAVADAGVAALPLPAGER